MSTARLELQVDGSGAAAGANAARSNLDDLKSSATAADAELRKVGSSGDQFTALKQQIAALQSEVGGLRQQVTSLNSALAGANDNIGRNTAAFGRNSQAGQELQHVIRSVSDSLGAGASFGQVFRQEFGRIAQIAESAGGALGGVGAFLAGPWGIALTLGAAVLTPFIGDLLETEPAADKAKNALDEITNIQQALASAVEETTGKINEENAALARTASLAAPSAVRGGIQSIGRNALDAFKDVRDTIASIGSSRSGPTGDALALSRALNDAGGNFAKLLSNIAAIDSTNPKVTKLQDTIGQLGISAATTNKGIKDLAGTQYDYNKTANGTIVETSSVIDREVAEEAATTRLAKAQAHLNDVRAEGSDIFKQVSSPSRDAAINQYKSELLAATREVDAARDAQKKPKRAADYTGLERTATNDIANYTAQFTDTPTFVDKAKAAIRKLDDDAADLEKRKPPNYAEFVSQIRSAQGLIENNLNKPYDDFIKAQQQSFAIAKLNAEGFTDQADALKIVNQLEKQQGTLSEDQKQGVLDTVQAMKAEQREQEILQAKQKEYLDAIEQVRSSLEGAFAGGLKSIKDVPKQIFASFQQLQGKLLFDKLFGPAFQELQDQADGTSVVKNASAKMADAVGTLSTSITKTDQAFVAPIDPLNRLASAADTAAQQLGSVGARSASGSLLSDPGLSGSVGTDSLAGAEGGDTLAEDEIVVIGKKIQENTSHVVSAVDQYNRIGKSIGGSLDKLFGDSSGILGQIGSKLGTALGGAAEGQQINSLLTPIGKLLGFKTSQTGAEIGGGIGSVIPIPGASEIGSILGSIVGGLFKKTKKASATITGLDDALVTGNSSGLEKEASTAASTVQDDLSSLADQLGATIGSFAVSIGVRKKSYRVDPTGHGYTKTGSGAVDFGSDADAAIKYAVADAIKDGAIQGISATQQRILQSAKDINTGLQDALAVGNISKELKQIKDPVNAALDDLNDQFTKLKKILQDASASPQELADAQELYNDKRLDIINKGNDDALKAMQEYENELKGGTSSPLSPQLRYSNSKATLNAIDAERASGQTVDFDTYKTAADAFLAASRDAQGSDLGYFADVSRVTSEVQTLIDQVKTTAITTPVVDFTPVVSVITTTSSTTNALLTQIAGSLFGITGSPTAAAIAAYLAANRSAFPRYISLVR